jgi:hypothetical protein
MIGHIGIVADGRGRSSSEKGTRGITSETGLIVEGCEELLHVRVDPSRTTSTLKIHHPCWGGSNGKTWILYGRFSATHYFGWGHLDNGSTSSINFIVIESELSSLELHILGMHWLMVVMLLVQFPLGVSGNLLC